MMTIQYPLHPDKGPLLSKGQNFMVATLILLVVALAGVVVLAYININTAASFQSGLMLNNLANIQRKVIELHLDTNRILRDRSTDFERLILHRDSLQRQLQLARADMSGDPLVTSDLRNIEMLLDHYTYEINRLAGRPTDEQFRSATTQIDNVLDLLEGKMETLYGSKEREFYANIEEAIELQRTSQALAVTIGGLLLILGGLLVRSVRRSVSDEFAHAYDLLVAEVAERRRAEEELRQHNAYLAALHDTSLALMNRLDTEDLLVAIVRRAAQMLHTDHGYAFLADPDDDTIIREVGTGVFDQSVEVRLERGQDLAGRVWANGGPLVINDYDSWPHRLPTPGIDDGTIKAAIGVPLRSGDLTVGVIGLAYTDDRDRDFSEREVRLLDGFAQLASIALDNARLFSESEQRAHHVDALYRADQELYRHLDMPSVLATLVDVAVDILRADKSMLLSWDEDRRQYVSRSSRGFRPEMVPEIDALHGNVVSPGLTGELATLVLADTDAEPYAVWDWVRGEGIRSLIHVPIIVDNDVFGIFHVSYIRPHAFGAEDVRLMQALAQRAAAAIQNARLYEQAQQAAAIEERQRLARELHDAVTQTLFSASIIADILPRLWDTDSEEARRRSGELRELTRGALAEMRALLLELRPHVFADTSLVELLHQLGEATVGRARVPVDVEVDDAVTLPRDVKTAFYRIAQEALNNIAKHANATRARVVLRFADGNAQLSICDDGVGFDLTRPMPQNLGLPIMHERAAGVGAQLVVDSHPGEGTTVTATWRDAGKP